MQRAELTEVHDHLEVDVAIIGGGIAGLWIHNNLIAHGYSSLLIEKDQLGCAQTLASQGMIHGGIKYTLAGATTGASETIAAMPERWNQCLAGEDPVDLQGVETLSQDYYMFSDRSVTSKVTAFFGSKAIEGRVSAIKRRDYTGAFANAEFKGSLYKLQDIVLDTESLISRLASVGHVVQGEATLEQEDGRVSSIRIPGLLIKPTTTILAAGLGNEALIRALALPVTMQRRPLQQVIVTGPELPDLYAHAVTLKAGDKPRITFTTHQAGNQKAWYLGGQLAETGVDRSEAEQVEFAKKELAEVVPWVDLTQCEFATLRIDRAEAGHSEGLRPDRPFARRYGNVIVSWPTKLTLAPMLGDMVLELMPPAGGEDKVIPDSVPRAQFGVAPWL
ncbi:MAG: FAD-dependent oxidoreductase [Pseudomonadales bacterium]|nr:FAD-dependent oxidoreductase [Pseudomonadales bacterium]MBO6657298.1 FAD-dependent oxidoreductase [Pseudomonadales bacterium]MBO6703136.1 FAD-dependent oxidoreductase [Pseudomonadales bacterium]MBO7007159.1 FAD-dependent oxidoreductase [Pseudomonadales bacterium]